MQNRISVSNVTKFLKSTIQQIPTDQIHLGKYQKRLNKRVALEMVELYNKRLRKGGRTDWRGLTCDLAVFGRFTYEAPHHFYQ